MTRIMVTGTSGFIGSHLAAPLCEQGHSVEGEDRGSLTHGVGGWSRRTCDLLDARRLTERVTKFTPEIVLHLAARTDLYRSFTPGAPEAAEVSDDLGE